MKILVTGGAGFIGSNLVDELIHRNYQVDIIDDLSAGKKENLNPKAIFYQASICDEETLESIFKRNNYDFVFHLAAWARVPRSIEDPIGTHTVNVNGTLNILEMCHRYKVKRLIMSSSSSIYGQQEYPIMNEEMKPSPMSPYGLHKLIGEQYATMFSDLFDMEIVSLRYFNVYGKRQLVEGAYSLVIGKFLDQKANKKQLTIYGDGTQTRAYTHVSDVVNANILAMQTSMKKPQNLILNIGTDIETSVNDIAKMIGGSIKHIIPNPRGRFEAQRSSASYIKALEEIGWEPTVAIEKGIKDLL